MKTEEPLEGSRKEIHISYKQCVTLLTLACSRSESIMSRSTLEGLEGRRGMVMLFALDSFLPGF